MVIHECGSQANKLSHLENSVHSVLRVNLSCERTNTNTTIGSQFSRSFNRREPGLDHRGMRLRSRDGSDLGVSL